MTSPWTFARRTVGMNPSAIREILKLTDRTGVISLAGGLPAADAFPVQALREATARVLRDTPQEALQYAASEGFALLRQWVAQRLSARGMHVGAKNVLITTGSQQGLDLVGKAFLDADSCVGVEAPTYLGALQAFAMFEPRFQTLACDEQGPLPESIDALRGARLAYLLPNFQNPTGRCMSDARRDAIVDRARARGLPMIEDDPYGELWFDHAPPAPLAARWPEGTIYLGSLSKVLAPGLRLGWIAAPDAVFSRLLQAKQASDLHTCGFNQRVAADILCSDFLDRHVASLRARYRAQRDAMQAALQRHLPAGCRWQTPQGGMFFWIELPEGLDASRVLPLAIERGVAFVPGAAFFADRPRANTARLSFVTVSCADIEIGVQRFARALEESVALAG